MSQLFTLTVVRDEQPKKALDIVAEAIFQFERSSSTSDEQSRNVSLIPDEPVILLVRKLERFNDVREVQPENIPLRFVLFVVSHALKSSDVNPEQLINRLFISVTLLVSKLLTFRLVNPEQSTNIPDIFVTLLVLKPDRSSDVNALQP